MIIEFIDDVAEFNDKQIYRKHIFLDNFSYCVDGDYFERLEDALSYCVGELL